MYVRTCCKVLAFQGFVLVEVQILVCTIVAMELFSHCTDLIDLVIIGNQFTSYLSGNDTMKFRFIETNLDGNKGTLVLHSSIVCMEIF